MYIEGLIKDVEEICLSYLTTVENMYIKKEWDKFYKDSVCGIAASHGWLDLLIWAREQNYEWDCWVSYYAAQVGHLDMLKWSISKGCKWNGLICKIAAEKNHVEMLEWTKNNGCVCGRKYHEN